jgi:carboxymethylenebutenolidase
MEIDAAEVRFPGHGGDGVGAFLARPSGPGPWPAAVVVHEVFGPTDHVRDLARRLASEGFVALAPDLWERDRGRGLPEGETDLLRWKAFVETIPDARIVGDLAAAARHLGARPEVRRGAIGAVGFSMGGVYAFHLACEPGAVAACVDFYGRLRYDRTTPGKPKGNLDRVRELKCPLLGIFGALDPFVPLADVLALKEALGPRGSVIAYPRAGHGFLDPSRPAYREEEAKDAWRRAVLFLRERLAPDTLPADAKPSVPEYRAKEPVKGKWYGPDRKGGGRGRARARGKDRRR